MSSRLRTFDSSVGTKIVIGATGFGLFIYLLIHIGGNLLIFFGPEVFNKYAYTMEEQNPVLPAIEVGLLLVFLIHIYKTVRMFLANKSARPVGYEKKRSAGTPSRKTLASSTMIVSGLWLLAFLVVHVKAFRFDPVTEWHGGGRDLYRQELFNLRHTWVAAFYVISMVVVGSHLWHGISSALQSLGVDHPVWTPRVLFVGKVFAVAIAAAFAIIAVWVNIQASGVIF